MTSIAEDHEHLLACWDRTYLNADTHRVAQWCGWSFDEAMAKLEKLASDGLIPEGIKPPTKPPAPPPKGTFDSLLHSFKYFLSDRYPSGPNTGKPMCFWTRPTGAYGLPIVEDTRLALCGVVRAVFDHDLKQLTYQGEPELHVRRVFKREGLRIPSGYRLVWLGPDPTRTEDED
jgi:hypothetical protein